MSDSFYLRKSVLEISSTDVKEKDEDDQEIIVRNVSIKVIPAEYNGERYAIGGKRTLRSNTRVNLTKIDNTDLIKSVGSETTDETVNTINQVGGVVTKLISVPGMLGAAPTDLCITEKMGKLRLELDTSKASQVFDGKASNCIQVTFGPVPKDAIPAGQLPLLTDTRFFYFAACRDATVTIDQGDVDAVSETVKISDPLYLQYVQFPNKGTVTLHSGCGVSVVTEKSPVTNPTDIVDALAAQGKAISDALKAAGGDDDD